MRGKTKWYWSLVQYFVACSFVFSTSVISIRQAAATEAWPVYWVKQTESSPAVLNTPPDELVFNGETLDSVAQFNVSASNDSQTSKISEAVFFARIKAYAASVNPMIVFLHGCCSGEAATLEKARRLAAKCSMPVIMYRWPAFGNGMNYSANENVLERCKGRALRFFNELETSLPANQTIFIGHSMGTRILIEVLSRRAETLKTLLKSPYRISILAGADAISPSGPLWRDQL